MLPIDGLPAVPTVSQLSLLAPTDTCRCWLPRLLPSELPESSAAVLLAAELERRWASVSVSSAVVLPVRDAGRTPWPRALVRPDGIGASLEVDATRVLVGRRVDGTGMDEPDPADVGRRRAETDLFIVDGGGGGPIAPPALDVPNPPDGFLAVPWTSPDLRIAI